MKFKIGDIIYVHKAQNTYLAKVLGYSPKYKNYHIQYFHGGGVDYVTEQMLEHANGLERVKVGDRVKWRSQRADGTWRYARVKHVENDGSYYVVWESIAPPYVLGPYRPDDFILVNNGLDRVLDEL
jgi:hypothetical protein